MRSAASGLEIQSHVFRHRQGEASTQNHAVADGGRFRRETGVAWPLRIRRPQPFGVIA